MNEHLSSTDVDGVHPTALIDPGATLGEGVSVGPYSIVGPGVTIGAGSRIGPHVFIEREVTIGADCRIHKGAVVGTDPQDLKYEGEATRLVIGDRTVIGAGSVVTRDVPSGVFAAGNPCRVLREIEG